MKRKRENNRKALDEKVDEILCDLDDYTKQTKRRKRVKRTNQVANNHLTKNNHEEFINIRKNDLIEALKLLKEPSKSNTKQATMKLNFNKLCTESNNKSNCKSDQVPWESPVYAIKLIRQLILDREWEHLKEMIRILLKGQKIWKNYVKEITYLYYLINSDVIDPAQVFEYFQLNFAESKRVIREFDIWYSTN